MTTLLQIKHYLCFYDKPALSSSHITTAFFKAWLMQQYKKLFMKMIFYSSCYLIRRAVKPEQI